MKPAAHLHNFAHVKLKKRYPTLKFHEMMTIFFIILMDLQSSTNCATWIQNAFTGVEIPKIHGIQPSFTI